MPTKIASCRHELPQKKYQPLVNSTWDKAPRWVQDRVSPQALRTFLVYLQLLHGKPRRVPRRLLASRRGVSMKTAFNHTRELIEARVLRAVYTKIASNRNTPNLYILLDVNGRDLHEAAAINYMEKKVQSLKPTTPPRGAREGNESPAMRKMYERVGELLRRLRKRESREAWRLERAQERTRRAMQASVGMANGTFTPPTAEQEREWKALHDWELQRSREQREKREKAMLERPNVCGACGGSGWNRRMGNKCFCKMTA